jgi:uncharacterized membrane protein
MNKLVAIVYPDMYKAAGVAEELDELQSQQLIDMEDIVYAIKDENGKIKVHQTTSTAGAGAAVGSMWGLLIGMLFLSPLFGMALGAGTGALAGKLGDYGINDDFIKNLSKKMKNGSSVLFVSVRSVVTDKVVPEISKYGGELLQTNLSHDAEQKLQDALDQGAGQSVNQALSA